MVNLGEVIPEEEKEHFKGKGPLPEDWYKTSPLVSNKDEEPSPYRLLFDFMIGGALEGMEGMMTQAGGAGMLGKMMSMFTKAPPISILIETKHPKKGREHVRIRLTPFAIYDGPPEVGSKIEPDIIMRLDYYDFVRMLTGEMSFVDPMCDGLATIDGNMGAMMEFEGMFELFGSMLGMGDEASELGGLSMTNLLGGGGAKKE
ncbi:MAG: SCP2 sterol-binding domain-containing protein [Halobacteriota archaeon]|nr:SCP2 sterol-binding domain-containing protein [Halobacteriota archaeon]